MKGPNIFSYATSELSQDAMIAWLAAWADPGFAKIDYALHSCGINLLGSSAESVVILRFR